MAAFLSKKQVLHLHRRQLGRFGGTTGLRDEGALESALGRPQATFEGVDLYPTVAEKAAALFHSMVAKHPFADGNTRVAAISAELFVMVNGFEIIASNAELEVLTMSTARGEREAEEIAIWIEQRIQPLR